MEGMVRVSGTSRRTVGAETVGIFLKKSFSVSLSDRPRDASGRPSASSSWPSSSHPRAPRPPRRLAASPPARMTKAEEAAKKSERVRARVADEATKVAVPVMVGARAAGTARGSRPLADDNDAFRPRLTPTPSVVADAHRLGRRRARRTPARASSPGAHPRRRHAAERVHGGLGAEALLPRGRPGESPASASNAASTR